MLRIDELAFRIVCGLIAEDVRWSQVSSVLVRVDASPGLSAMVAELGARVNKFCDARTIDVEGDDEFLFTRDDVGHPAPNIDVPALDVYIEFGRMPHLRLDAFRLGTRRGARPPETDLAHDEPVMR